MKRLITLLLILSFSLGTGLLVGQTTKAIQVVSHNSQGMQLRLSIPQMQIEPSSKVIGFQTLKLEGSELSAEDGKPALPIYSATIAIPPTGDYEITVSPGKYTDYPSVKPEPVFATEDMARALDYNKAAYSTDEIYPNRLVEYSRPAIIRDFRVIQITVNPVQWHASTGELRVYDSMEININFTKGSSENELPAYNGYSKSFESIYESLITNFDAYRDETLPLKHERVLLIHGNSTDATFIQQLNQFVTWKRQKGFEMNVVSTSVAGTNTTQIKNYITAQYNNIETRPDFIILLGDTNGSYAIPTFTESWSSYGGKGDYPYTQVVGNDTLGDIFIGRISAESLSQLTVLFSKIYAYEKNINNDATAAAWLNRMVLIGDPSSSGISTRYVNKYIKEISLGVNPAYTYIENYSGGFPSTMNSAVNQGVAFFNYRGYIGMSGWSPSSSLVNGAKMPHATILTCSTGNFENGTATSEEFMRLGTTATPAGAITAMGMSTSGTHTMYNNVLAGGVYDGLMTHRMRTMGQAMLNAKLYLYNTYSTTNVTQANYFAHWCNLMGDPTVEVFVGIPGNLVLNAPLTIPAGTNVYDTYVLDDTGTPMQGASVTVYSNGSSSVVAKGFTDETGFCSLFLPSSAAGEMVVTASKHDYKPVQQTLIVDAAGSLVFFDKGIEDNGNNGSIGNGDGFANAGETIALTVSIRNSTAATISGITATLSTADPQVIISSASSSYPDLVSNDMANSLTPYVFSIARNIEPMHDTRFTLTLTDASATTYSAIFHFGSINAALDFSQFTLNAGGNAVLDPAENGIIQVSVMNNSPFGVGDIYGQLRSLNDMVVVTDSTSFYGNFSPNGSANSLDGFGLFARPLLIPGMQIPMQLKLYNASGFEQITSFNIPIGTVSQNTPFGPDSYGYFIYDVTDTAYPDCPTYDWIEINPSLGGSGTILTGLNDSGTSGNEGDQNGAVVNKLLDLPFSFRFYNVDYSQITVCVNGFIAFGASENGEFRNYRLPGAMGPSPMIAPFWDDLRLTGDAGIYQYYNAAEHYYIIQYHKMRNGYNGTSEETFQVIFYDPLFHPTGLGDGMLKFQYKTFNNVDIGGGGYSPRHGNYSTIGIKDHTNSRGLEYTYNNVYPAAAAPLSSEKALLITTQPVLHQSAHLVVGELIVNDPNNNGIVEPGEQVELGVKLNNLGLDGATNINMVASVTSPYVTVVNNTSEYNNIPGSGWGVNIDPLLLNISLDCPNDHTVAILCNVTIEGNSWQFPVSFTVHKPAIQISGVYVNDLQGNGNGLADPGETLKMIVNYTNNTDVSAKNVTSNINCLDTNVSIANPSQLLTEIPAGSTAQAVYQVTLSNSVITGNFITFYLTYLGELINAHNEQIQLSVGVTGMNADFELTDGGFTPSPLTNGWQWGGSTYAGAHSGNVVWGTLLNSQYPNNANYSLISPPVYVGSNFVLEFWHRYAFEDYYDGGNVKITINNGSTWNLINPEGGYPEDNIAAMGEAGYSNSLEQWTQARFDLSAYANQTVRFKWTMMSDQGVTNQGWFIDDVKTTGFTGFAGMVSGQVSTGNPTVQMSDILIESTGKYTTHPLETGAYELYLPSGSYVLTASGDGFQSQSSDSFVTSITEPAYTHDFYLGYFKPITDLGFGVTQSTVVLFWNAPVEPEYPVAGYNVFRRINAGHYEQLQMVNTNGFSETLSDLGTYHYYVEAVYAQGVSAGSAPVSFEYPYMGNDDPVVPMVTALYQNYPNPFNPETTFNFSLKEAGKVRLDIYNLRGQLVRCLVNGNLNRGIHNLVWNGKDTNGRSVGSGVYLYRLETKDYSSTRKAMLLK